MFNNPFRKYQTGGSVTDEQRQEAMEFVTWIKSNVEGFKDKSIEEIAKSLIDMRKSEEGEKSYQDLYKKFKSSKSKKSKFEDGGKFQQFICKHANGGLVNCGCGGMTLKAQDGVQVPNKSVTKDASRRARPAKDAGSATRRKVGYTDIDGNHTVYEDATVNGNSAQTWAIASPQGDTTVVQRYATYPYGSVTKTYEPGTNEYETIMSRLRPFYNMFKTTYLQPGGHVLQSPAYRPTVSGPRGIIRDASSMRQVPAQTQEVQTQEVQQEPVDFSSKYRRFNDAFAAARKAGLKQFTWKGKPIAVVLDPNWKSKWGKNQTQPVQNLQNVQEVAVPKLPELGNIDIPEENIIVESPEIIDTEMPNNRYYTDWSPERFNSNYSWGQSRPNLRGSEFVYRTPEEQNAVETGRQAASQQRAERRSILYPKNNSYTEPGISENNYMNNGDNQLYERGVVGSRNYTAKPYVPNTEWMDYMRDGGNVLYGKNGLLCRKQGGQIEKHQDGKKILGPNGKSVPKTPFVLSDGTVVDPRNIESLAKFYNVPFIRRDFNNPAGYAVERIITVHPDGQRDTSGVFNPANLSTIELEQMRRGEDVKTQALRQHFNKPGVFRAKNK